MARPQLSVRLHPVAFNRLKARAEEASPGYPGGVAEMVRTWIYERLDFDSIEYELEQRRRQKAARKEAKPN